jgi:hypothetical protein
VQINLAEAIEIIARDGKLPVDEALQERNRRRAAPYEPDPLLDDANFDAEVEASRNAEFPR